MRVIFLGRKRAALDAYDWLVSGGHQVLPVVPRQSEPSWAARPTFAAGIADRGAKALTQRDVLSGLREGAEASRCEFAGNGVDLVVSYLFPEKVQAALLELPSLGAVNFHPAPLPEYGGLAGYNQAILEGATRYGATAHYMVEEFDRGSIIEREMFGIDPERETALSLEGRTRPAMLCLFKRVMERFGTDGRLPAREQEGTRYVDRAESEALKLIDLDRDSPADIARKVRAFWFPPYHGAKVRVGGREFTLVSEEILAELAELIHNPGPGGGAQ